MEMDIHCIVSKLCELNTSPFFTEDTRIKHLRTSVSPRGRFCDGEPEYVVAVVVDAAVVVVAAAIAVVTDGDACCDGSLLGAPPFSPVKIIRGQRERGNDGAIEQWNDGSESRVVNKRAKPDIVKSSTDNCFTYQPPVRGCCRRRSMPCLKRPLPLRTLGPFHHDLRPQSHRP